MTEKPATEGDAKTGSFARQGKSPLDIAGEKKNGKRARGILWGFAASREVRVLGECRGEKKDEHDAHRPKKQSEENS